MRVRYVTWQIGTESSSKLNLGKILASPSVRRRNYLARLTEPNAIICISLPATGWSSAVLRNAVQ
jgi:hypothetical protein